MRKTLVWISFFLLSGIASYRWYFHGSQYIAAGKTLKSGLFPCSSPIYYSIGAVDPRFDLSAQELAVDLKEAESVWEAAVGKNLFELAPQGGDLSVNFIYDRRQESLDKLKAIGLRTDQSLAAYNELKARYSEMSAGVDRSQAALSGLLAAYKPREASFNAAIAQYNRRGKVTQRQLLRMNSIRAALEREFAKIKKLEKSLNEDIDLLNAVATTLNQLIVELNLDVEQYNREGAALGRYEEGVYRVAGGFRSIDIYKYDGHGQLSCLLAHELGHALGLNHVSAPAGLMYALNKGGELKLSSDDLSELGLACTSPLKRFWRKKVPGTF